MAEPLNSESMPVSEAKGRYLAKPLVAQRSQPAADLSAMDGYAVASDDLSGPWRVIGESKGGAPFTGSIAVGEAVRISTGALIPDGGGAVLIQEDAERYDDDLRLLDDGKPTDRYIRRAGFDFEDGDILVGPGERLGPAQIALATAAGHSQVEVGKLPSLCVIDAGNELVADPGMAETHQLPASNGVMLAAMSAPFVSRCERIGPVADRMDALLGAFAMAESADVIVTSGGASVGDHDLVRPALEAWGAEIDFRRVAMRPGKPLMVAQKGYQIVLGLPGNPVSAYVTAFLFLLPLLRRLAGAGSPLPHALHLPTIVPLPGGGTRTELLRGRMEADGVRAFMQRDSSALRTLARANALIRRDVDADEAMPGDIITVYPLQYGGNA
ncbi:molybdopterin molybdenumtransferase MoeA [Aurantiacibacter aquimixticola]|uniref:Molybdopterin molybdenumtransferase n=2 Tax=Aurantiacibacter aquimixticola TaxID=1958945 RepID=A0A419RWJ1_9SPHN|nr:molybdopterin molybdenumtransferase MoeA [Aurantiacibacter aquimixticola]